MESELTAGRPSIDRYFLAMAELVATRSTWKGMHVGCVMVRDKQVVSTGYNGTPRGWHNDIPKDQKEYFCHAEENAIVQAARHGTRLDGCTAYVTVSPCVQCARMLINAGVYCVVYSEPWDQGQRALDLLNECDVETEHVPSKQQAV